MLDYYFFSMDKGKLSTKTDQHKATHTLDRWQILKKNEYRQRQHEKIA